MVTVSYSERIQINTSKGKRQVGEIQEKPGIRLSWWSHMKTHLILQATYVTEHVKYCQPGKLD